MLNDLSRIERGLTAYNIPLIERHADIKDMAKGQIIRPRLNEDGSIDELDLIGEAKKVGVWTVRDGQHNGFPGLKTEAGLLALDEAALTAHKQAWDADTSPAARRRELERLIAANPLHAQNEAWPKPKHRQRIADRLEQLRSLQSDPRTASVPACMERFLRGLPSFPQNLVKALSEKLERGDEAWLDIVQAALTGPVPLAIDVAQNDFERDAGDPRQIAAVSAALAHAEETKGGHASPLGICALSGRQTTLYKGSVPQPNLPGLGQSFIFTRNDVIPSLTRYDRTGPSSFPLARDLMPRLNATFGVLTAPDAKGYTWRSIPHEAGDKSDLLIVSLPAFAGTPIADALAENSGEEDVDAQTDGAGAIRGIDLLFERGERVIEHSHGIDAHGHAGSDMIILVLRAVDPSNRKAVYHRQTGARELFEAAQRWSRATANSPKDIAFQVPVKGQKATVRRGLPRVAPLSITRLSRMQFVNEGRRRLSVAGTPVGEAFELFLGKGAVKRRARAMLRLLLRRHSALLGGLAAARSRGIDHLKDFDPGADLRRDALRSLAWIGVLLYQLDRRKEDYMASTAFRLGQLLAGADTLHIGYCADMRGGNVPPRLAGNAVLTLAGNRPARALAILKDRLKPYLAWAKREEYLKHRARELRVEKPRDETQKKNNRLSWAITNGAISASRMKISIELFQSEELDKPQDDMFKAELLLGYLAGFPSFVDTAPNSSNDIIETNPNEEPTP